MDEVVEAFARSKLDDRIDLRTMSDEEFSKLTLTKIKKATKSKLDGKKKA